MTTIAADALVGVMCADDAWDDGTSIGHVRKVHRVRGELVGLAGMVPAMDQWLEAWRSDPLGVMQGSMRHNESIVLLLNDAGLMTWDRANGWGRAEPRWAIGSGDHAARGALGAGASCRRAVTLACGIDAGSRLPVHSYRLRGTR